MAFRVVCRAAYLTGQMEWRHVDHNAAKLIKAVKGHVTINGYATVRVRNVEITVREANKGLALTRWFAPWAAERIQERRFTSPILVPIPNSSVVEDSPPTFRTALIAEEIARCFGSGAVVCPYIRWDQVMTPSHNDGPRDPEYLFPHLRLIEDLPEEGEIILVDDVFTSGGHMTACSWKLDEAYGADSVAMGITCGRTTREQLEDPLTVDDEIIDRPKPFWV